MLELPHIWCCILLAGSLLCISTSAQEFGIEGKLLYQVFVGDTNSPIFSASKTFKMERRDCEWTIRTSGDTDRGGFIDFFEAGSDGTNTFLLKSADIAKLPPRPAGDQANDSAGRDIPYFPNAGIIFPGEMPNPDDSFVFIPWLGYASGCYYSKITNAMVKPVYIMSDRAFAAEEVSVRAKWDYHTEHGKLISGITFISDGKEYVLDESGQAKLVTYDAPYNEPFTNAIFEALEFTNISEDIAIPLRCNLTLYRPDPEGQKASALVLRARFTASVDRYWTSVSRETFLPPLSTALLVDDYRFVPIGAGRFSYQQHAREWFESTNAPLLAKMLGAHIKENPEAKQRRRIVASAEKSTRAIVLFGLVFVSLTFSAAAFFWSTNNKTKTEKQQL